MVRSMRSKKYEIYAMILIVLTSIGVSYAYFNSDVSVEEKSISVSSKKCKNITYR